MSVETPPIFIQSGGETAERARRALTALTSGGHRDNTFQRGGIVLPGDLAVTENGTPNMSVNVATGQVFIPGSEGTYQGVYSIENRGTLNVAIAAADPTNARKDLIVAKVQDAAYSGGVNAASIVAVTGTPSGSPAEPAVPANAWVLAMIDVPALDTAITNSQITDRRTTQTGQLGRAAALGGVITCTSNTRPPHVEGRIIYETDTDNVLVSDGANWLPPKNRAGGLVAAPATLTATSATFTSIADIAGLSITWTASSTRRYRAMLTARGAVTDIAGSVRIRITDGAGTSVAAGDSHSSTASVVGAPMIVRAELTGLSGSQTYKVRGEVLTGGGNGSLVAGATDKAHFTIEDVGGI